MAFDKNDHVIGIARKAVTPPLQLKVELVQQDICQQWREWASLWGAHLAGFYVLTDQHSGAQVAAIRSAILVVLADTPDVDAHSAPGKDHLQKRLAAAINKVLTEEEGYGGVDQVYFRSFLVQ